jgi:hypothetical protein
VYATATRTTEPRYGTTRATRPTARRPTSTGRPSRTGTPARRRHAYMRRVLRGSATRTSTVSRRRRRGGGVQWRARSRGRRAAALAAWGARGIECRRPEASSFN